MSLAARDSSSYTCTFRRYCANSRQRLGNNVCAMSCLLRDGRNHHLKCLPQWSGPIELSWKGSMDRYVPVLEPSTCYFSFSFYLSIFFWFLFYFFSLFFPKKSLFKYSTFLNTCLTFNVYMLNIFRYTLNIFHIHVEHVSSYMVNILQNPHKSCFKYRVNIFKHNLNIF